MYNPRKRKAAVGAFGAFARGARKFSKRVGRFTGSRTGRRVIRRVRRAVRKSRRPRARASGFGKVRAGTQWEQSRLRTGRLPKLMTRIRQQNSMQTAPLTTRLRSVKSFNDHGSILCHRNSLFGQLGNITMQFPTYFMLLNGQNNGQNNFPLRALSAFRSGGLDGSFLTQGIQTMTSNGSSTINMYDHEQGPVPSSWNPLRQMYWTGSNIKMNLWGARTKPVKFTIQVCGIKDHRVSPFANSVNNQWPIERQQAFEPLIKQYYFNPISTLEWKGSKHIKILKTFDHIINPPQTVDGDADPVCHQLNWNMKWGRTVTFTDETMTGGGLVRQPDDINFTSVNEVNWGTQAVSFTPNAQSVVFLMIRVSEFTDQTDTFSNLTHGSFDFDVRNYWRYANGAVA